MSRQILLHSFQGESILKNKHSFYRFWYSGVYMVDRIKGWKTRYDIKEDNKIRAHDKYVN